MQREQAYGVHHLIGKEEIYMCQYSLTFLISSLNPLNYFCFLTHQLFSHHPVKYGGLEISGEFISPEEQNLCSGLTLVIIPLYF